MSQTFSFGKNFSDYLKSVDLDKALGEARKSLSSFLQTDNLKGLSFLDLGAGSGLYSKAALDLGAKSVVSIDSDKAALECCRKLKGSAYGARWEILEGDILDSTFMNSLPKFDIVYAWGVVHHTNRMWRALANAGQRVKSKGKIYLGVYNHADAFGFYPDGRFGNSRFWRSFKSFYSNCSPWGQKIINNMSILGISGIYLTQGAKPLRRLRSVEDRGMTWQVSMLDWLGGYPYNYARPNDVFRFMVRRDFALQNIKLNNGLLTNHYLFKKSTKGRKLSNR